MPSSRASDKRAAPASAPPYPIAPHMLASCPLSTSQRGWKAARMALPSLGALKGTGGLPVPSPPASLQCCEHTAAGHGRAHGTSSLPRCPALTPGSAEGTGTRLLPGAALWGLLSLGLSHAAPPVPAPSALGVLLGSDGAEGTGFPDWGRDLGAKWHSTPSPQLLFFCCCYFNIFPFNTDAALT